MGILISFIVLSILVIVHELGHFIMAKRQGVRVEVFSIGFGPKLFAIKKGETEYRICVFLFGGYVKMAGEGEVDNLTGADWEYPSKRPLAKFKILFAGPFLNYLLGLILFMMVFYLGNPTATSKIGGLMDGMPAQQAGLQVGDVITSVNGIKTQYWQDITDIIQKDTQAKKLNITVLREGKELIFGVDAQVKEVKNILGQKMKIPMIGIALSEEIVLVRYHVFKAIAMGLQRTLDITVMMYKGLWYTITGAVSVKQAFTGPVGIIVVTSKAANLGFIYLLQIAALISIALGLTNLLPIPALDGGHILFLAIEGIIRRPISQRVQSIITQVGFYILIALLILLVFSDIMKFGILDKVLKFFK